MRDKQQYWRECINNKTALIIDFQNTAVKTEFFRAEEMAIGMEGERALIELSPEGVTKLLEVAELEKAARENGNSLREPVE